MSLSLSFFGGAGNVTGSSNLLTVNGARILVDCGLYQERDLRARNFAPFPVPPRKIDAVLLTHAHVDHCGLLPKLVKEGYAGTIYATAATAEIARIVLLDAAKIQEEDVAFKMKRHARQGRKSPHPYEPLYTVEDARAACERLRPIDFLDPFTPAPGVSASFYEGGHILGAAMIRVVAGEGDATRVFLFSGDAGRWDRPLLNDPSLFSHADYVLCESTYGDRDHSVETDVEEELARLILETRKTGGHVVIPSFAVERTQDLLYHLSALVRDGKIPKMPVFVDSPMAIGVTEIFRKHPDLLDEDTRERLANGDNPCQFPGLAMTRTADESKTINTLSESAVIIAGSGMCTGGRIKHHLRNNLPRPESTILFIGYQAHGTLGRILLEGADEVRLFGETVPVKARIARLQGMSAHADRQELLCWLSTLQKPPRRLFLVHGESESTEKFADFLREKLGWPIAIPDFKETVELD